MNTAEVKAALRREIALRRKKYPVWVKEGKFGYTEDKAVAEIAQMEDALALVEFAEQVIGAGRVLRQTVEAERLEELRGLFK